MRNPNHDCHVCYKPFYIKPSALAKSSSGFGFCSKECFGKFCQKPKICPVCSTEFLAGKNAKTCSRACSNKNREGIKYDGRRKSDKAVKYRATRLRLFEDRGAKCEECPYEEHPEVLQVHHIVERCEGGSDEPENLKILCPTCHAVEHLVRRKQGHVGERFIPDGLNPSVGRKVHHPFESDRARHP